MEIARHEVGPYYAQVVVRQETAYLAGQIADDMDGDVRKQTEQVLEKIDALLAGVGSSRSNLLSLTVWLADFADYGAYNEVYGQWVDPAAKPVRATVRAELLDPRLKIEMMAVAAVPPAAGSSDRLLGEAGRQISYIEPEEAIERAGDDNLVFVDVRDGSEREQAIPDSVHASRGMLEWYLDPTSEFHDPRLTSGRTLVMVCGGGSRGALATRLARSVGIEALCLRGGIRGWRAAGGAVESST